MTEKEGKSTPKTLLKCRSCKRKCDLSTIRFFDEDGYKSEIECPFGFQPQWV
jgi:hypothetical protein